MSNNPVFRYDVNRYSHLGVGERIESHHYRLANIGPVPVLNHEIGNLITEGTEDTYLRLLPLPSRQLTGPTACASTNQPKTYFIPQGDRERKEAPMFRGLIGYFPAALFAVAQHSYESDRKHNGNNPAGPQWNRGASTDHPDCIVRHLADAGLPGTPDRMYHLRALAWRALALLQEECERNGAAPGVSSVFGAGRAA